MIWKFKQEIEFEISAEDEEKARDIANNITIICPNANISKKHKPMISAMFDENRKQLQITTGPNGVVYYKPSCTYGYVNCISDPEYIKHTYPEWYKELGCPTKCDDCINGEYYDNEDK